MLQIEFSYSEDYDIHSSEFLRAIKSANHCKYDMLHNKNSSFLFWNFNDYLTWQACRCNMLEMLSYLKMFTVCLSCKKRLVIFHRKFFWTVWKRWFWFGTLGYRGRHWTKWFVARYHQESSDLKIFSQKSLKFGRW